MIRAILIDPYAGRLADTVREIQLDPAKGLAAYYEAIGNGCETFTCVYPKALKGECIYVDDNGLWTQTCGFRIQGLDPIMGRGIVVGTDDNGNTVSSKWNAHALLARIEGFVRNMSMIDENVRSA